VAFIYSDSVLSRTNVNSFRKQSWMKRTTGNGVSFDRIYRESVGEFLDLGDFFGRIYHAAVSGAAYEDGIPEDVEAWIVEQRRVNEFPVAVFFHLGVNSFKGDLTKGRSEQERKEVRDTAFEGFGKLLADLRRIFPLSKLVFMGSANFRMKRGLGDGGLFHWTTTSKILLHRHRDLSQTVRKIVKHAGLGKGLNGVEFFFVNALGHVADADVVDKHGHVDQGLIAARAERIAAAMRPFLV
jgi:hypothetical protein